MISEPNFIDMQIAVGKARGFFPRGLLQPAGSFRFSADALLLGAFLYPGDGDERLLDLGTGCGVIALMMLLRHERLFAAGLDVQGELLEAAMLNAKNLGVGDRFEAIEANVFENDNLPKDSFDIVLANPPYRNPKQGRLPASASRHKALFEEENGLEAFIKAAATALKPKGQFGIIFPAARLDDIFKACNTENLTVARVQPIQPRLAAPPSLVLVEAAKGQKAAAKLMPPLIMHEGGKDKTILTKEILTFCPELNCNSGSS